ncbi:hypothetical protein MKW92_053965 [Papaver armeniacum]|nr:hypothetical protein MKW92_053965 [Papaver armeniacum]
MVDPKTNVGGGVQDVYGEDRATEDQLVTPRTFSIASGCTLLRDLTTTKDLHSLKRIEMHTTYEAFFPQ